MTREYFDENEIIANRHRYIQNMIKNNKKKDKVAIIQNYELLKNKLQGDIIKIGTEPSYNDLIVKDETVPEDNDMILISKMDSIIKKYAQGGTVKSLMDKVQNQIDIKDIKIIIDNLIKLDINIKKRFVSGIDEDVFIKFLVDFVNELKTNIGDELAKIKGTTNDLMTSNLLQNPSVINRNIGKLVDSADKIYISYQKYIDKGLKFKFTPFLDLGLEKIATNSTRNRARGDLYIATDAEKLKVF